MTHEESWNAFIDEGFDFDSFSIIQNILATFTQ